MKHLYCVLYTIKGYCFVRAKNFDDACDKVECYIPSAEIVQSYPGSHEITVDYDRIEEIQEGDMPSTARSI